MSNNKQTVQTAKRIASLILGLLTGISCYCGIFVPTVLAREPLAREVVASELDHKLRDALLARDYASFQNYLYLGADPTEWFENTHEGWVFCAATEKGLEPYLQLIIDKGFDVNFRQTDIYRTAQLLLSCAVNYDNFLALEMLIAAGADAAVRTCPTCKRRFPGSPMALAARIGRHNLALWLLDKGNYSTAQIQTVISGLENFSYNEANPNSIQRLELIDRIRDMGYEVNPRINSTGKK